MLNRIIAFSIRNKLLIGLFVIAMAGYGIYELTRLPIDAVPDITNNQVQVITVAPSFGATDIERLVTFPIEQANSNINGLKEIRSFSRFGLSLVTIVFDDATDLYWARQQVAERLQKVKDIIPKGIGNPELGPITTGLGEIYQYVVRPLPGYETRYNETELRTIQDWIVRRQLLGVEGVAEVSSFGGKLKQYEVAVNPNQLQAHQLTITDIFDALEKNNQNTGGAYIEKNASVLFIRSEGLIGSEEDLSSIAVKTGSVGNPVFLRDVADIRIGYATRYGAMCYNDKGEVSGAVVMMLKGANSSKVIKNVKARIEQIKKTLPQGVTVEPFLDRTKMVNNAIGTVEKNLAEGAVIVVFILVLFLGNLRAGLLVASIIPLAMLFAVIMMNAFGVSGNLMSLGALDFGLIVDGAVIIVEAVMHQLTHSKKFAHLVKLERPQMDEEVKNAASRMMNSAVFGQIIILIVYLPIFSLQGIEGKMFKPMAQTVAFALLGAFLLSLTYVPMMSAWMLSRKLQHKPGISDRIMFRLEKWYQHTLEKALRTPRTILAAVVILFAGAIFVLTRLGGEFIPELEEGDFAVDTRVLAGSSLSTTIESTQKAAHILTTRFPEVEKVVTKIGSGEIPTDPMPMDASDMMVILKDKKEWTSAKTFDELSEKMSKAVEEIPGITTGFQFPVQMRFNELMTGARQDVVCKIFGEDLDTLAAYAQQLAKIAAGVKGCENLYVEPVTGMPQIIIRYNRDAVAQYHLNIADINRVVNTAFAGQTTGLVFEGEKRFDLVVRLNAGQRKDIEDVQRLLIPSPNGTQIPLMQLAEVAVKNGPKQIQREDAKRRIIVGFNVRGRDVESIVNELQQKVQQQIRFPAGYFTTYGGAFENLRAAKERLQVAVPVSLLLIFVLLYFAFNSIRQGLLIYSAIPLSAIGGILFLALRGMPFSISAGVGFIALFGVAVLNGIVLIAEFNRLQSTGMNDMHRVVLMGTKVRLRPVLMTAFVASLGFLPMALSNGAGAEVQRPLATVVIGGLLIATFLTLFVLPVLYLLTDKRKPVNAILPGKSMMLIGLMLLLGSSLQAQTPITLQAAVDSALKNNTGVQLEKIKAQYQLALTKSANTLPPFRVSAEGGQINSVYTDTRFGVSQSFQLPAFYQRQKNLLEEEWKLAISQGALREAEIRKWVTMEYYHWNYLLEKSRLLQSIDSIYAAQVEKASIRFNKGETDILEKTSAENQRSQINLQQQQVAQDLSLSLLRLGLLMNTQQSYQPVRVTLKTEFMIPADSTMLLSHPLLNIARQQQSLAKAGTKLEQSKRLPELNIGYSNSSIMGTGADNLYYPASRRFHTAQVGIGIPLLGGSQKARIEAARINESAADKQLEQQTRTLQYQYRMLIEKLTAEQATVKKFEQDMLPNAHKTIEAASLQLNRGSITYIEWVMLTSSSFTLQSNYLDAVKTRNETIFELQYLNTQK
jgi:cobalt-zinc-cadmium resistance protein CzcA